MNTPDRIAQLKHEIERENSTVLYMMHDRSFSQKEINAGYDRIAQLRNELKQLKDETETF